MYCGYWIRRKGREGKKEMGCASSKRIEAAYQPAPTSFAVFDINAIEEPWLKHLNNPSSQPITHVPAPILHVLDSSDAPQSWAEVSKALEHLKPVLKPTSTPPPPPPQRNQSFHTIEELDANITPTNTESHLIPQTIKHRITNDSLPPPQLELDQGEGPTRIKSLKDNMFIVRDRLERQKEDKASNLDRLRRDPLSSFPEKCPPGGNDAVVIYTTSLGGVRKTFEDCNRAREVLEAHRVVFDERDVSLHGGFLREVKDLLGDALPLPRVFVKGRYLGGVDELVELNESSRLSRILNVTRVERGIGRQACEGCGGARFVPCFQCAGSCKLVFQGVLHKQRCPKCNENGLVHCPACISTS